MTCQQKQQEQQQQQHPQYHICQHQNLCDLSCHYCHLLDPTILSINDINVSAVRRAEDVRKPSFSFGFNSHVAQHKLVGKFRERIQKRLSSRAVIQQTRLKKESASEPCRTALAGTELSSDLRHLYRTCFGASTSSVQNAVDSKVIINTVPHLCQLFLRDS